MSVVFASQGRQGVGCAVPRPGRQSTLSLGEQDLVYDWQQAASSVLVAVGKRFVGMVMEELLSKFQPGILPHGFVVQTLANLSVSNGRRRLCLDPLPPGQ